MITSYEITYVVTNILGVYIIYKLMRVFFDETWSSRKIELMSYVGYYLINTVMFFVARVPFLMMSVNMALFFCLALNYRATMKRRIWCALSGYMILMCAEVLGAILTGLSTITFFESIQYASSWGLLVNRVISLLVVAIISGIKNIRKEIPVPSFYWVSMVFISVAPLCLFVVFFSSKQSDQAHATVVIIIMLATNFIVLFLYDNLYRAFAMRSEKLLLEQQNAAYVKQLEIMTQSLNTTQILRHDMKNHMITLQELCADNRLEDAREYVGSILPLTEKCGKYAATGHYAIDSIVNFKLQTAADMGVVPEIDITVPRDMKIPHYETIVILGNLLDNALTALENYVGEKTLSIKIKFGKGCLIIVIVNSYDGRILEKNGKFQSLKDGQIHGVGLMSVKEALREINGHLDTQYDGQLFIATALFPVYDI